MASTAPIIVAAELAPGDLAWLDSLRSEYFPPERNHLPAHLTMFHHLPPSILAELHTRLGNLVRHMAAPEATIGEPLSLGRGVALRVRSPALEALRADMQEAFTGLLTPQDAAAWRPHVTIQNKVSPEEARRLHSRLSLAFARARPLGIAGVATYFYRGGPWEPISRFRFQG